MNHQTSIEFYNQYHQNFWNKVIHMMFIPCIVLSFRVFLNKLYILDETMYSESNKKYKLSVGRLFSYIYIIYYYSYGLWLGIIMNMYFISIEIANYFIFLHIKKPYFLAFSIFIFSWTMQFIGHEIEGNKPALFDSILQSFTAAPLYSLQAFLPNL